MKGMGENDKEETNSSTGLGRHNGHGEFYAGICLYGGICRERGFREWIVLYWKIRGYQSGTYKNIYSASGRRP